MSDMPPLLVVERVIRATPARVFEAWTDPRQMEAWWGPKDVQGFGVEIDLRVGGAYRIGNRLPDGSSAWIAGHFEAIDPPDRLVYTWCFEPAEATERVTVEFRADPGGTRVVVSHAGIVEPAVYEGHLAGWNGCLDGLRDLFA